MFNRFVKNLLLSCNIYVARSTSVEKAREFLSLVKPVKTEHALVRVGGDGDGGYLIPNDMAGIDTCFSPGVSTTSDFENELTHKGIRCFLADFSVDGPSIENPLFDFEKKFLGVVNDETYITLEEWISVKAPDKDDLILQMDIEGGEYPVIFDASYETLKKFRIIVIEFHGLDGILTHEGYELIRLAFTKLRRDFDVVHIHPNNCTAPVRYKGLSIPPVMEFTFLRKDRIKERASVKKFPNPLDRTNVANNPDFALPDCWY